MAHDVYEALYEACDRVHASCDARCPVFLANGGIPDSAHDFSVNRGCDCFKDGSKMAVELASRGACGVTLDGVDWDLPERLPVDTNGRPA